MSRRVLVLLLAVLLLAQGCAAIQYAIQRTPERLDDALTDPIRRTHLVTQVGLSLTSMGATLACAAFAPTIVGILVCPVAGMVWYFGWYEFILEPWSKVRVQEGKPSLVGPYFERGPQDGEAFVRP